MQLDGDNCFLDCYKSTINALSLDYKTMGINIDEIGMAWIIDTENNIVWHNGWIGDYNSYLGFDKKTGTAVVILSNLSPRYHISATVMGVKPISELRE